MDAGEEHFFNVGLRSSQSIDSNFVLGLGHCWFLNLATPITTTLGDGFAIFGNIAAALGPSAGAEGWDEFDTAFIERQCMAEVRNYIVRAAER